MSKSAVVAKPRGRVLPLVVAVLVVWLIVRNPLGCADAVTSFFSAINTFVTALFGGGA